MWNRHFTGISLQGAVLKLEPGHLDHQSLFTTLSVHTDSGSLGTFTILSLLSSTNFPSLLLLPQQLKCIVGHLALPSPHRSHLMHIWQDGRSKYTEKFTVCKLWIGNTLSVMISKEWHVKIQTGVLIPCRYLTGPWSSCVTFRLTNLIPNVIDVALY